MPRLAESNQQRIDRQWRALCEYKMNLLRIPTREALAKRLGCSENSACTRVNSPMGIKLNDLLILCKTLRIDMRDLIEIIEGVTR